MSMSDYTLLELTARNNAEWCEIVCSTHNAPGKLTDDIWLNGDQVPIYYPNAVTLTGNAVVAQSKAIERLIGTRNGPWSVKDSFNNLDLSALGFHKLFDAEWLLVPETSEQVAVKWAVVDTYAALTEWETAWGSGESSGLFMAELLNDERVRFIAIYEDEKIVAGAILNSSEQIVGISNIFYPAASAQHYLRNIVNISKQLFPNMPIVGYESGSELSLAKETGFTSIGSLSVWLKE